MPSKPPKHKPPRAGGIADPRPSAARRGYDADWRKFRADYLSRHPLCVECERSGVLAPAAHVDHVRALVRGGDKYDESNLRALCHSCHSRKTAREDGSFGRKPR